MRNVVPAPGGSGSEWEPRREWRPIPSSSLFFFCFDFFSNFGVIIRHMPDDVPMITRLLV